MSSWACLRCRTVYAVGIEACPQCGSGDYSEGGVVAKANAEGGATHYVAEGDPVPDDLPEDVRLVGPGAPADPEEEEEAAPDPAPDPDSPESPDPGEETAAGYDGLLAAELAGLCKERGLPVYGTKADLMGRLAAYDDEHPGT